ncbi:glyoxalase [Rhizobium altiplani]|uniref:Glyoxalase n=1 Tax=Rhizobium altiplani TaxID=1864509 RepID=A0A109J130_9HYPH|nr:VOC family protein [Rhizobium altiplani]KWV40358.1 glyoxalase [Rhizobium altiplani]
MTEQDPDRVEVLPVLPSLDLDETLAFYRDQLGFDRIIHQSPDYLILRRNEMELHFWLARDRALCEATSVYLRGRRIAALHAEYQAKRVARLTALERRPWGMEEFYIHDPHGNLLRFGRIPVS